MSLALVFLINVSGTSMCSIERLKPTIYQHDTIHISQISLHHRRGIGKGDDSEILIFPLLFPSPNIFSPKSIS